MSVSIAYARDMVATKSRYAESPNWKDKVYRMPPDQVLAIYHTMLNRGEFDPNKRPKEEPGTKSYVQPTLFDFGLDI